MAIFTQIIILIVILAVMFMVLLAIRHLTHFEGFEDSEETTRLKEEIKKDSRILSNNNIFHNLVDTEIKKEKQTEKVYNSNSNDPFSRKE